MRYFKRITIDELKDKVESKKATFSEDFDRYDYRQLTRQIEKDLNVDFDCENLDDSPYGIESKDKFLGYHTLENGLTFLGISAGGDWQCAVYWIIYYDGFKLRAYVPKCDWNYNLKTKEAHDGEEDFVFRYEDLVKDIKSRIKERV